MEPAGAVGRRLHRTNLELQVQEEEIKTLQFSEVRREPEEQEEAQLNPGLSEVFLMKYSRVCVLLTCLLPINCCWEEPTGELIPVCVFAGERDGG